MITSIDSGRTRDGYKPLPGYWDEALLPSGFPRRHWRKLFVEVGRMGYRQLSRRWEAGQQLIQSQGITYNIGDHTERLERAWPMDPIPLVIPENEWQYIEQSVIQRASLLNAMLADLYGERRLLSSKTLPAALVFPNPNFQRSCVGIVPAGGAHLHTYAADIARSPDGRWWVVADRTQAPSGIGYTLQNRLLSARTFPGIFNHYRVRQLAAFFDLKREALLAMAQKPDPTVVVMSPGPHNETYFEHSFLAGQWGFTLVEGADLAVIDGRVFIKTLGGLKTVDVIVRRLDDDFCDPLELRPDSLLGVPGLVDAARSGSVVIDNALGSGLVESPAFMAFLPGLCRQLLGDELRMPSVATWWCGHKEPLDYVLANLDRLVVKPAFPRFGGHSELPDTRDHSARENLGRRIHLVPETFVAQERVALSTAPVHSENGFIPRHAMLRVYAVWNGKEYSVLPGGLTRVSNSESSLVVSMQRGGGSKDTWVLGSPAQSATARRQVTLPVDVHTSDHDLPSRVADNLFWLGRYTERVESGVRLVRTLLPALSGEEDYGRLVSLETTARLLVSMDVLPRDIFKASIEEQRWQIQRSLTELVYDSTQTTSLRWNLKAMRRAALQLKERLSADTWRVLQQLETQFSSFVPGGGEQRYFAGIDLLDSVVVTLSAFSGLLMENTTQGFGWRFLEIGRRLERARLLMDLLQSGLAAAPAENERYLQILLQIADSSITYRTRYPMMVRTDLVLELLFADESNPRAVCFQLVMLLQQIERLQELRSDSEGQELALARNVVQSARSITTAQLAQRDGDRRYRILERCIAEIRSLLSDISEVLTSSYLSNSTASRFTASS